MGLEHLGDQEVENGEAYWLPVGQSSQGGGPSFAKNQTDKGLLGRPVRDDGYPNSQTVDTVWQSPNTSFQSFTDSTFGGLRDKDGDEFSTNIMDEKALSGEGYAGDKDNIATHRKYTEKGASLIE